MPFSALYENLCQQTIKLNVFLSVFHFRTTLETIIKQKRILRKLIINQLNHLMEKYTVIDLWTMRLLIFPLAIIARGDVLIIIILIGAKKIRSTFFFYFRLIRLIISLKSSCKFTFNRCVHNCRDYLDINLKVLFDIISVYIVIIIII